MPVSGARAAIFITKVYIKKAAAGLLGAASVYKGVRMPRRPEVYCSVHPLTRMICPRCEGSKGGRKTTAAYANSLSKWGKQGGRPKKTPKSKAGKIARRKTPEP